MPYSEKELQHKVFSYAIMLNNVEAVKECLFNLKIDINETLDLNNKFGFIALHYAASCNCIETLDLLLNHIEVDPNKRDKNGWTALHHAVYLGNREIVVLLLKHPKVDPNVQNTYGQTALHFAIKYGYAEIGKSLIEHSGINLNRKDYRERNALDFATYLINNLQKQYKKIKELFTQNFHYRIKLEKEKNQNQDHCIAIKQRMEAYCYEKIQEENKRHQARQMITDYISEYDSKSTGQDTEFLTGFKNLKVQEKYRTRSL